MGHSMPRVILVAAALLCAVASPWSATAQLETRGTSLVSSLSPAALATGDFNGDGNLDIAVVDEVGTTLDVLFGQGDGTFGAPVAYTVGSTPVEVTAGYLTHRAHLDLVVSNAASDDVSVLLGNGDGTFQPAVSYTVGHLPGPVQIGDVNNDGDADLVFPLGSCTTPCILTLLGNGDGTFQSPITSYPGVSVYPVGLADFNGDGKLDIGGGGCAPFGGCVIGFLWGNGDGTFQAGVTYPETWGPGPGTLADFNNDGKADLAVAAEGIGATLLSNGNGTFEGPYIFNAGGDALRVSDFNGDGKQDLVLGSLTPGLVGVMLGNGDGTFKAEVTFPAGGDLQGLVVGDFNNDHQPDAVADDLAAFDVITLLNTGVVAFKPTTPATFATQLIGTTSKPQTVTLTNSGTSALSISSIKVTGQFKITSTCPRSVAAGGSCSITIAFIPQTQGTQNGTVSINDSASIKPQVIDLVGAATVVSLSPPSLQFPPQKLHTTGQPMTSTLTNTGATPLTFTGFKFAGSWPDYTQTNTCGTQIAAGATCQVTVSFTPVYTGEQNAVLQISDTGGASPQGLEVSGVGEK